MNPLVTKLANGNVLVVWNAQFGNLLPSANYARVFSNNLRALSDDFRI